MIKVPEKANMLALNCLYEAREGYFTSKFHFDNRSFPWRWYACREQFHRDYYKKTSFFILTKHPNEMIAFIRKTESFLGLLKEDCSEFKETTNKNVLYVTYGNFWKVR